MPARERHSSEVLQATRAGAVDNEATDEADAKPQLARGPKLRVLLAEDDPQVAELVEALLADLGHSIIRKPDAAQFNAKDAKDLRGAPVWDNAQWRERT